LGPSATIRVWPGTLPPWFSDSFVRGDPGTVNAERTWKLRQAARRGQPLGGPIVR